MKIQNLILIALGMSAASISYADGVTCPDGYIWGYDTCTAPNFSCVADRMQAVDSDIYYAWTADQIDAALKDPKAFGHDVAVESALICNKN